MKHTSLKKDQSLRFSLYKRTMTTKETPEERKVRFRALSSDERKSLIRKKLTAQGLGEGSGVSGKNLSSYDKEEIIDLLLITKCVSKKQ